MRLGNISFAGARPSEQRQPNTRTALVSSKMDTTGTKSFTSKWVLFGRLIIRFLRCFDCVLLPVFIILRRLISGNVGHIAPGE